MKNIDPAIVEAVRAHQTIATGLGEWCCKCTPMEWRAVARRSEHVAAALAPLIAAAVDAARAEGYEQGAARVREAVDWEYEAEHHEDYGGADTFHHVVCGDRHIAEVASEADARLIVSAVNAHVKGTDAWTVEAPDGD